ncbi:unnamed protein product [Symbiodinium sp. CCMP2456]|nr:unnamed protein product [Symbiodinium sp. CCMP2456]
MAEQCSAPGCAVEVVYAFQAFNWLVREDILVLECSSSAEPKTVPWAYTIPHRGLCKRLLQDICDTAQPENTSCALLLDEVPQSEACPEHVVELSRWLFRLVGCRRLMRVNLNNFQRRYNFLGTASLRGLPSYPVEILDGKIFLAGKVKPDSKALKQLNITNIAGLGVQEHSSTFRSYVGCQFFPVKSTKQLKLTLTAVLQFMRRSLEEHGRILILGDPADASARNHATACVVAFLMQDHQLDFEEAVKRIPRQLCGVSLDNQFGICWQLQNKSWNFGSILLEVYALSGQHVCALDVEPFVSVRDIKRLVERETGVCHFMQRLLVGEAELDQDHWEVVARDFYASGADTKYQLTLHLVRCEGEVWDGLRDLLETLVQENWRNRPLDTAWCATKLNRCKSELLDQGNQATFVPIPGMFGGIEVAWEMEGQGREVLNVTASSRMDYNFRECYIVSSEGFRKVKTSRT